MRIASIQRHPRRGSRPILVFSLSFLIVLYVSQLDREVLVKRVSQVKSIVLLLTIMMMKVTHTTTAAVLSFLILTTSLQCQGAAAWLTAGVQPIVGVRPRGGWTRTTAFVASRHSSSLYSSSSSSNNNNNNVDTISLDKLGDNHEAVGAAMGESVARWLDAEWMPQDIHAQIGQSCAASYVKARTTAATSSSIATSTTTASTDDMMTIMTIVAEDLMVDWNEKYEADAFVNAWDVANYVSDYLTRTSGNEGCECSAEIH